MLPVGQERSRDCAAPANPAGTSTRLPVELATPTPVRLTTLSGLMPPPTLYIKRLLLGKVVHKNTPLLSNVTPPSISGAFLYTEATPENPVMLPDPLRTTVIE